MHYEQLQVSAKDAPDYSDTIKKKMALSNMQTKVKHGNYGTLEAFGKDIQLIVDNCNLYNAGILYYTEVGNSYIYTFYRCWFNIYCTFYSKQMNFWQRGKYITRKRLFCAKTSSSFHLLLQHLPAPLWLVGQLAKQLILWRSGVALLTQLYNPLRRSEPFPIYYFS